MKLKSCFLIFGLCALILQFSVIHCVDEEVGGETEVAEEATDTDTENTEETNEEESEAVEETGDEGEEVAEEAADEGTNEEEASDDSEDTEEEASDDSEDSQDDSGDENEEEEVVEEDVYVPPPVGTELGFTMATGTSGLYVNIYFTQMDDGLSMHCDVSATAGTDAALLFPAEFPVEEEESGSEEVAADEETSSDDSEDNTSVDGDANVVTNEDENAEETETTNEEETEEAAEEETAEENNEVDNGEESEAAEETEGENVSTDGENTENNDAETEGETEEDSADGEGRRRQTRGACTSDMPTLYLLKTVECCSDPSNQICASTEAYKLGCIDKTGSSDHEFPDLTYDEVEEYCLAIADKEAPTGNRFRTPKFIATPQSFFRTFSLLNFNNINFLSSGTKTITSSASTGTVSVNFPNYIQPSTGGSYNPGFFDTLPYIRLEGLTADYINVIIILLLLTYLAAYLLPALNLGPLFSQLTAPFERMGDFVGERMDILEDKVKASIRKYNRRRYYNDVRRVDYDLNYEYIDDDYYYYDK